jgi:uncharacterized protein YndB with AHSA1/START domain
MPRTDRASRWVRASPAAIYRAFLDPQAWLAWLPPKGMTARLDAFEPRVGGAYRMTLAYDREDHATSGKSSEHADIVRGRFVALVPNERVVQSFEFESDDPAFAGTMTMTWSLTEIPGGTEVIVTCEEVPDGIRPEDHAAGLSSSLENLAAFVEAQ